MDTEFFKRVRRQLGLATTQQLTKVGWTDRYIAARVESGAWQRLRRGVYKLSPAVATLDQRELAVQLALGPRAVLSHQTAARHLGILVGDAPRIQVTVDATRMPDEMEGVDIWRSRHLERSDVQWRPPFLITELGRTSLDLSGVYDPTRMDATVDACLRLHRSNWRKMLTTLEAEGKGKRGASWLRELIAQKRNEAELAASVMESFAMELGLATGRKPRMHYRIFDGGRRIAEIDLAWPEVKLAAEFDGWLFHCTHESFVNDRARDLALFKRGWITLRFTWEMVTQGRQEVINLLATAHQRQAASLLATAAPAP